MTGETATIGWTDEERYSVLSDRMTRFDGRCFGGSGESSGGCLMRGVALSSRLLDRLVDRRLKRVETGRFRLQFDRGAWRYRWDRSRSPLHSGHPLHQIPGQKRERKSQLRFPSPHEIHLGKMLKLLPRSLTRGLATAATPVRAHSRFD